jgi:ABC-type phosphate transport system permease subunit
MKAWLRWVYDWITVIVASLIGVPSILLQLLTYFDAIDLSPLVGADKALKIITAVAITKAILSVIESRIKS